MEVRKRKMKHMVLKAKGARTMEILHWAMAAAMELSDPLHRAHWYEYCSRISSPNQEAEGSINEEHEHCDEQEEEDLDSDEDHE
ncbi:hypothetical protein D1007_10632 [Hordeum vulgare]|nr:hypothetical protein D1007_10632 [Hordeum vulgare]